MPVPGGPETGQHGLDSVLTSAGEVELYSEKKILHEHESHLYYKKQTYDNNKIEP